MGKAKITLSPNHVRNEGWGFSLRDKAGNSIPFNYNKGYLELDDKIAEQFEDNPDLQITYSDGSSTGAREKDVVASKAKKPKGKKPKKLTKTEIKDLDKAEQVALLKKLGSTIIPKLEGGRVKLILKLQGK